jgi:DNA polymerase elongation subunit (family B)
MEKLSAEFYLLDIDYKTIDDKPVVRLFGITKEMKRIVVLDRSFQPYFYVKGGYALEQNVRDLISDEFKIVEISAAKKKYMGGDTEVLKVIVDHPASVPKAAEGIVGLAGFEEKFEYDIRFYRRYLVDKGLYPLCLMKVEGRESDQDFDADLVIDAESISQASESMIPDPYFCAFDIETYNYRGNPRAEIDPIMMISVAFSDGERKVFTWKNFDGAEDYVHFVPGEMELINEFVQYIKDKKPLFISGYNSDDFDLDYLRSRASKYGIKLDFSWDKTPLKFQRGSRGKVARSKGTVHLDMYSFVRTVLNQKLKTETLDLDSVAAELLGEKKHEMDWENIWKMWEDGGDSLKKLVDYCLQDSVLTLKLTQKLMPLMFELTKLVGLPLFDISRVGMSQYVEWYLMRSIQEKNELAPNKPKRDETIKRLSYTFEGAFVYQPEAGLYENVVLVDFRSLYPSIIVSHNISPDTLGCECCKKGHETPEINKRRHHFCKKRKGLVPDVLESLIKTRMDVKKQLKEKKDQILAARSEALKLMGNSFYGYLGFKIARWYCLECAEATTAWGRQYIKETIDEAKKEFKVIYSDTDSVMMAIKDKTHEDVFNFIKKINKKLPEMMELELEDFYKRGIFVPAKSGERGAKKKYALVDEQGNLVIKGFEFVRRDWSIIARETQKEVLDAILDDNDPNKALKIVQDAVRELKKQEVPLFKVAIYTQLRKPIDSYKSVGPHVAAAKKGKVRGYYAEPGTIIKYVVTKGTGSISNRSELLNVAKDEDMEYDPDYYINNQLLPATERLLGVVGFTDQEIRSKEQAGLGKWVK